MNYQQTLDYLFAQLPMFHRVGASAYKPSLQNTLDLCVALGNPQHKFKSVHIAGTNGKGSTSHMLAAIFQASGYRTGLYTSPHLKDFRERIKINAEMISEESVIQFVAKNKALFESIQPSFFEMTVAMAFEHFAKENVDIAIIEVGMGGRLDSTNIIQPELSIITNIGFDHMAFLGDTLELIAREKAGIIKQNIPVIISKSQVETKNTFKAIADERSAPIQFADEHYHFEREANSDNQQLTVSCNKIAEPKKIYQTDLPGNYQLQNLAGVLNAIDILKTKYSKITDASIHNGLAHVKSLTGLRGRWDMIQNHPLCIADTGHNEDGIKEILKQLSFTQYDHLHWVFGMVNDKDITKVLSLLPSTATYYFCKPNIPRGLDAEELQQSAKGYGLLGNCYENVSSALNEAKKAAQDNDLVLIAGSTFVVAEVI